MSKKETNKSTVLISEESIENRILLIRGKKVMLDRDLANLYGVSTKRLNEQVKRNLKRFPSDFMFQMSKEELTDWKSQFAISNKVKMGIRKKPYLFTQEGVAMLSSVLSSDRAIQVNVQIMRAFTKLRELMISHKDLARKIEDMECKFNQHDKNFVAIFQVIRKLLEEPRKSKNPIGFHVK